MSEQEKCHCGKPVHIYEDGFTRGLCEHCSTVRCDLDPANCRPVDSSRFRKQPDDPEYDEYQDNWFAGHVEGYW